MQQIFLFGLSLSSKSLVIAQITFLKIINIIFEETMNRD